MYIRFDSRYKVFSNGERIGVVSNPDGTKTWHYAMRKDHPYFSTSLVIGDYDYRESATPKGIPLEFWYYQGMADRVPVTYKYTEKMFSFLEHEIGVSYPYPVYREAPVEDYMYGAMETTTATVFGDYMLIDPHAWWQRNYVNVNAHELAHQWFGNCIAHLVNKDVWLTESFATYYAKMFERSVYGEDYFQNLRNDEMNATFEAAKKNDYPVGGSQGGVQRIYQKGSLVLGMLRDVMGEKEFRDAVKNYVSRYSFNYAQTADFIRSTYDVTGRSLQWFFEEWILHGGEPSYSISYAPARDSSGTAYTEFRVEQVQEITSLKGVFKMPVRFEVHYKNGLCDSLLVWIDKKEQSVRVPNMSGEIIEYVLFDPGRRILKHLSFRRSFEELSAQLMKAKNMIDRYDALVALQDFPLGKKKDLLILTFQKETFHLLLRGVLEQLSGDTSAQTIEIFRKALLNAEPLVRKTALQLLDKIPFSLKNEAEKCLNDSSYANIDIALERLCISFPSETDHYLEVTKDMEGWRGRNIRIRWLEIAIRSGKHEYLEELISYTGQKFEFETRMNSFSVLERLGYTDPITIENARNAGRHWNNKLAAAGMEYLKFFKLEQ
jgi:aminopeptidase N